MKLAFAFNADAAQITPDGKVWVLGGDFDTVHAREFPATHPAMSLVVKLLVLPEECQLEHQLRVELTDEAGIAAHKAIVLPLYIQPDPRYPQRSVGVGLVLNFVGLTFSRPDDYAFHILVDDLELGTVPLAVAQVKPAGTDREATDVGSE